MDSCLYWSGSRSAQVAVVAVEVEGEGEAESESETVTVNEIARPKVPKNQAVAVCTVATEH